MGLRDGEALTHPWLSKALEKAQARVEQQNFEIRKNLLKFDNVVNDQRKVIYEQRRELMEADHDLDDLITEMRGDVIENLVQRTCPPGTYAEQFDAETLQKECARVLNLALPITDWVKEDGIDEQDIEKRVRDAADAMMSQKINTAGIDVFRRMCKTFVLQLLDQHWKEHLLSLDHLRQGINLRAFGQRDPLNEYKAEAFGLFESMLNNLRESVTQTLAFVEINISPDVLAALQQKQQEMAEAQEKLQQARKDSVSSSLSGSETSPAKTGTIMPFKKAVFDQNDPSTWVDTPRNSPCPCGSGKKYKHCHGAISQGNV